MADSSPIEEGVVRPNGKVYKPRLAPVLTWPEWGEPTEDMSVMALRTHDVELAISMVLDAVRGGQFEDQWDPEWMREHARKWWTRLVVRHRDEYIWVEDRERGVPAVIW